VDGSRPGAVRTSRCRPKDPVFEAIPNAQSRCGACYCEPIFCSFWTELGVPATLPCRDPIGTDRVLFPQRSAESGSRSDRVPGGLGRRGTRLPDRAAVNLDQSILVPKNSALTHEVFFTMVSPCRARPLRTLWPDRGLPRWCNQVSARAERPNGCTRRCM